MSEQQFMMMNYGLKEKAGLFWSHYSGPSAVTKEFQNDSFSIICVKKREKEEKEGKASQGRMGRQEGRKEMEAGKNKRKNIFPLWSTEKALHSLMSFPYQTSQS